MSVVLKCTWVSISPGIRNFPWPSTRTAAAPAGVVALGPTATIRPSAITTFWPGSVRPATTSTIVTFVIASGDGGGN